MTTRRQKLNVFTFCFNQVNNLAIATAGKFNEIQLVVDIGAGLANIANDNGVYIEIQKATLKWHAQSYIMSRIIPVLVIGETGTTLATTEQINASTTTLISNAISGEFGAEIFEARMLAFRGEDPSGNNLFSGSGSEDLTTFLQRYVSQYYETVYGNDPTCLLGVIHQSSVAASTQNVTFETAVEICYTTRPRNLSIRR